MVVSCSLLCGGLITGSFSLSHAAKAAATQHKAANNFKFFILVIYSFNCLHFYYRLSAFSAAPERKNGLVCAHKKSVVLFVYRFFLLITLFSIFQDVHTFYKCYFSIGKKKCLKINR